MYLNRNYLQSRPNGQIACNIKVKKNVFALKNNKPVAHDSFDRSELLVNVVCAQEEILTTLLNAIRTLQLLA